LGSLTIQSKERAEKWQEKSSSSVQDSEDWP
jgi:hypothetical protein